MKQLILRTCNEDLISYNNFQWFMGKNVAPDWDPQPKCGKGLHGLLWGEGAGCLLKYHETSKWLVGEIDEYVDLKACVKFPTCNIIFIGNREEATQYLYQNSKNKDICGLIMSGKNLKGGYRSQLTGEDGANIIAGESSEVKVGDNSVVKVGNHSLVTAGSGCSIIGDDGCDIRVGDGSTVRVGRYARINGKAFIGKRTYTV